jgi:hypothetical protein
MRSYCTREGNLRPLELFRNIDKDRDGKVVSARLTQDKTQGLLSRVFFLFFFVSFRCFQTSVFAQTPGSVCIRPDCCVFPIGAIFQLQNATEFAAALKLMGVVGMSSATVAAVMRSADPDGDGESVDYTCIKCLSLKKTRALLCPSSPPYPLDSPAPCICTCVHPPPPPPPPPCHQASFPTWNFCQNSSRLRS